MLKAECSAVVPARIPKAISPQPGKRFESFPRIPHTAGGRQRGKPRLVDAMLSVFRCDMVGQGRDFLISKLLKKSKPDVYTAKILRLD